MEPTRAPWGKPAGEGPPPAPKGGATAPPLQQTRAPWAAAPAVPGTSTAAGLPLPPVSRGELTRAPWAASSGPALTGRPVQAAVPHAAPRVPAPPPAHDWSVHRFAPPAKRITSAEQLKQFLGSEAARDFVSFILALNEAVKGKQLSDSCEVGADSVMGCWA